MGATTTKGTLFPEKLVADLFSKVNGHSTIAKLAAQMPIAFTGTDVMTFSLDGEVALVGEAEDKPEGGATFATVSIQPVKVVYQHRVSDEFVRCAEEDKIPYIQAFADGFAKKIARGLDLMAFHGVNPATGTAAASISGKSFDTLVTNSVAYAAAKADSNLEAAIQAIVGADKAVTGIAMAPAFASAMGALKVNGVPQYPEFRFGGNPAAFAGYASDVNSTVSANTNNDRAIVGDFANAFKWGYAANLPLEVIEYGDPDGQGDLKRKNQVVLRSEAYIGWGILDADAFAKVEAE